MITLLILILSSSEVVPQAEIRAAWPDATIPYSFHPDYPDNLKPTVRSGMDYWERRTCVRFKEGNGTEIDRVQVIHGSGCFSSVGRDGGEQTISIHSFCNSINQVTHELMHLLGVHHTQQRPDRENYVHVVEWNVAPGGMFNFEVLDASNVSTLDVPYDYGSILHYDYFTMSVDSEKATLVPRDPRYRKSMGNFLPSFYDLMIINRLYNCTDKCAGVVVQCQNGGVQDVNDCTRCRCPTGYGGLYCAAQPDGCFVLLNATTDSQDQIIELGRMNKSDSIQFEECLYEIKASEGSRVEVIVKDVFGIQSESCKWAGLEILTQTDTTFSGPRICKLSDAESYYISEGRKLLLKIYNRSSISRFVVSYRQIVS
ncbi:hypothetical protein PMAYCL1PPCAC_33150 [Pristionchus mayeri]|uniref:Zinc metalloproteinase n=1 Tax=Pristionchus mayeri TaxID=1317129 RepID=A0AAN5IG19_9BILA|nr:hypothetical protein PMAYCL1PPCAC_33150 [Pristionchus mayeri]